MRRFGGALLAEPVGSGKTWIALAVARAWGAGVVSVLAPAPLQAHWRRTARALGIAVAVRSHAAASRGTLPAGEGLAIVDEAHHYRHAATRRYDHVARWLVGRPVLLLSATPVVNRLADLAALLALGVRDDALAPFGVPSLARLLAAGEGHPSLGALVIARPRASAGAGLPAAVPGVAHADGTAGVRGLAAGLDALRLSSDASTAALLRRVLWQAAASSPAALAETLGRYERLLRQARDAAAAGRAVGRRALRAFAGELDDQLVLWELLPDAPGEGPDPGDLDAVRRLRAEVTARLHQDDARAATLRALLADGTPSVVFSTRTATVRWLAGRLGRGVAWCTGSAAGIGAGRASPRQVLEAFRASAVAPPGITLPVHLVTTDVAAEGLDLRRLARVVHYDLPWTHARLEQRGGRVAAVRGAPPVRIAADPACEARLGALALLERKRTLPGRVELGPGSGRLWLWREAVALRAGTGERTVGAAAVRGRVPGLLAGWAVVDAGRPGGPLASGLVWLDAAGRAHDAPDLLAARLDEVLLAATDQVPSAAEVQAALARLAPVLRAHLRDVTRGAWAVPRHAPGAARLLRRLDACARAAARARDAARLALVERAIRLTGGGHTAGEARLVAALAAASDAELTGRLPRLPEPSPGVALPALRLTGLVLVRAGAG